MVFRFVAFGLWGRAFLDRILLPFLTNVCRPTTRIAYRPARDVFAISSTCRSGSWWSFLAALCLVRAGPANLGSNGQSRDESAARPSTVAAAAWFELVERHASNWMGPDLDGRHVLQNSTHSDWHSRIQE